MVNKLINFIQDGQKLTVNYDNKSLILTVITPEIVRVFQDRGNASNSYAIDGDKSIKTDFKVKEKDDHVELSTAKLPVKIYDDEKIDVYDEKGNPLILDYRKKRTPIDRQMDEEHLKLAESEGHDVKNLLGAHDKDYYEIVKSLADDEQFYGLGDKTGFINKRYYAYDNWNTDNPDPQVESFTHLYKSIPILLGLKNKHPYGIFFDNTYRNHIDLGKESNDYYYYSAVDGNIDYYIIGGDSLKEVITNYTYLTGRVPMPQKWTLGYQQSRWGYSVSQKQVEKIAENLRKYDLLCDVLHLDIDYMRGYRVFTWRTDNYESSEKFVAKMRKLGFRIITIIDPGVKKDDDYKIYKEGIEKGYFVKAPDGTVYVNQVWPGDSVFPDFGRKEVRKWWARNCKYLVDLGVSGIWDDMNEPASFKGEIPDNIVFHNEEEVSDS